MLKNVMMFTVNMNRNKCQYKVHQKYLNRNKCTVMEGEAVIVEDT